MWRRGTLAAVLVALPISIVAMATMSCFFAQLADPCAGWDGNFNRAVGAEHHCSQVMVDSRTKVKAALTAVAVQGVILAAAALGIWGAIRSRQVVVVVAGLLMLLEMIPTLFSASPLALLAGIGFLIVAYRTPG